MNEILTNAALWILENLWLLPLILSIAYYLVQSLSSIADENPIDDSIGKSLVGSFVTFCVTLFLSAAIAKLYLTGWLFYIVVGITILIIPFVFGIARQLFKEWRQRDEQ
jgi:xanthine/uracil permease